MLGLLGFGVTLALVSGLPQSAQVPPVQPAAESSATKICIVGAGPSGLGAATRLIANGYRNITIFEKEAEPGGKAKNWIDPATNAVFPIGAVMLLLGTYPTTMEYAAKHGLSYQNLSRGTLLFNNENGFVVDHTRIQPPLGIEAAAVQYSNIRKKYASFLTSGFPRGIPDELTVSFYDFLATEGLLALEQAFFIPTSGSGYGSIKRMPAVLGLNLIDDHVVDWGLGKFPLWQPDFHELFTKVAAGFPDIRYSANITRTSRRASGDAKSKPINIWYTQPGDDKEKSQECDRLIIAFPQRLDLLGAFDLDDHERELFGMVKTVQYFTSVVRMPLGFADFTYLHALKSSNESNLTIMEPDADGPSIIFQPKHRAAPDLVITYTWKQDSEATQSQINAETVRVVSLLNRDLNQPNSPASPITESDIRFSQEWDYFPHVDGQAMRDGFFAKLAAHQGARNTYFTSGLRNFESIEHCLRSAHDLIDTYFKPVTGAQAAK